MSFCITLQFPTGRYLAASPNKQTHEWPPHPARLFLGLVDVLHRRGDDPAERAALEWLESLDPPAILLLQEPVEVRQTTFVPQNALPKKGDLVPRPSARKPRI